jgi:hypothetical protein
MLSSVAAKPTVGGAVTLLADAEKQAAGINAKPQIRINSEENNVFFISTEVRCQLSITAAIFDVNIYLKVQGGAAAPLDEISLTSHQREGHNKGEKIIPG